VSLQIAYQPHNNRPLVDHWTLVCGRGFARGNHPNAAAACAELAAHPYALTRPAGICPDIIVVGEGSVQVTGTAYGRRVSLQARPECPSLTWYQLHLVLTGH
jgi:hypothetical protein